MKRLALHTLRWSGLFSLSRIMSANMARILMYHNFSGTTANGGGLDVAAAREQFNYLRRNFRVLRKMNPQGVHLRLVAIAGQKTGLRAGRERNRVELDVCGKLLSYRGLGDRNGNQAENADGRASE